MLSIYNKSRCELEGVLSNRLGALSTAVYSALCGVLAISLAFGFYQLSVEPRLSELSKGLSDSAEVARLKQESEVLRRSAQLAQQQELARGELENKQQGGAREARPEAILQAITASAQGLELEVDSLVALEDPTAGSDARGREFSFVAEGSFESILLMVERMPEVGDGVFASKIAIASSGWDTLPPKLKAKVTARVE